MENNEIYEKTLQAREDYFCVLKGTLKDWWIHSEEEQKKMDSVIRAIDKYLTYLENR